MIAFEQTLMRTLDRSRVALTAGNLADAAAYMQQARELWEFAHKHPNLASRKVLEMVHAEDLRQLVADEATHPTIG